MDVLKGSEVVNITVRLDRVTVRRLDEVARVQRRSRNAQILRLLECGLDLVVAASPQASEVAQKHGEGQQLPAAPVP